MPWIVQRAARSKGHYYSAIYESPDGSRKPSVTLGYVAGSPSPAVLKARLDLHDPTGRMSGCTVKDVCTAEDEDAIRSSLRSLRHFGLGPKAASGSPVAAPASVLNEPIHPKGGLRLRDYVADEWEHVRAETAPASWAKEQWWWNERILPALGDVRLCDLDKDKWKAFLKSLKTCGGKSKSNCQTAYRKALKYAADDQEEPRGVKWIDGVHAFDKIVGASKRTWARPEPLTAAEIETFLAATLEPVHRAMFGLQIGIGLRCGEVILVRWQDVRWDRRMIDIRGTKNGLAEATIPMTPLAYDEMLRWRLACGQPKTGVAFTHSEGKPFAGYPRKAYYGAAKRSGLNEGRVRKLFPYSCRHTFATISAVEKVDKTMTKKIMRHSTTSTILEDAYEQVSLAETAAAFANWGTGRGR